VWGFLKKYRFRADRFLLLGLLFTVIFYQNCGRIGFYANRNQFAGGASFSSEACEGFLQSIYSTTYFPLLSQNCNACHSSSHGSLDLATSFRGFMSKSQSTIDYKATHPHGDNGINLTAELNGIKSTWDVGYSQYRTCVSQSELGTSGGIKIRTLSKIAADLDETSTPSGQNQWKTLEWDLLDETSSGGSDFNVSLKIEVRFSLFNGQVVGLDFRNPMMKLNTDGSEVTVKGLKILLQDIPLQNVTTYSNVNSVVSGKTYSTISPGTGIALAYDPSVTANSRVSLELQDVSFSNGSGGPGDGDGGSETEVLTWTELTSLDPDKNVFRARCISCHQGDSAAAGLNLLNYQQSSARAAAILERVTDPARPMPPSGLLGPEEIQKINRWSTNGAPQ
jgi:hypothetical protein